MDTQLITIESVEKTESAARTLVVQLNNLQGVALVRYNSAGKLAVAVAAAARFRTGEEDIVRVITPASLMASIYRGSMEVRPQVVSVTGKSKNFRAIVNIADYPEYTQMLTALTPGGRWAQLQFGRIGVSPNFETNRHFLNEDWRIENGTPAEGLGAELDLQMGDSGAQQIAMRIPTAWSMMVALGKLIGGIQWVPDVQIPLPVTIGDMVATELALRRECREKVKNSTQPAPHQIIGAV